MSILIAIASLVFMVMFVTWLAMKTGSVTTVWQAKSRKFLSVGWLGGLAVTMAVMFIFAKPIFFGMIVIIPLYWMVASFVGMLGIGALLAVKTDLPTAVEE